MKGNKSQKKYAILALALLFIVSIAAVKMRHPAKPQQELQTSIVKRGTVVSSVSGNGTLNPITTVDVKSNVGGTITELAVDEGDYVKAGQLIARIDPSDSISTLNQAKADYASAKAKLDQSKETLSMQRIQTVASIRTAEQTLESSRQSLSMAAQEAGVQPKLTAETIKQAQHSMASAKATLDQTKAALSPQKIAAAKAAYDEARASYANSEKNLNRQRALLAKGFVSKSNVDDAESQYQNTKAQLENAKSTYDTVKDESDQDLINAQAKVSQAQAALEYARANKVQDTLKVKALAVSKAALKQAVASLLSAKSSAYQNSIKNEDILQAQAALEKAKAAVVNAKTTLGYTTIVAPRSGVIVKKYAEKGSIVTAGRQAMAGSGTGVSIVDIADVSRMRVVVNVDETDVGKITLGQKVDVTIDSCHDEIFPGKVIKVAPEAEVNSNVTTVPVTVEISRSDRRLKPTMNATCNFIIDKKQNVLYLPVEAVTETDNGKYVTVITDRKPETRTVKVGLSGDDYCEIITGVNEGDTVVIADDETSKKTSSQSGGPGGGPPPM